MVGRGGQWQWQPESAAAAARPGRGGVVDDGAAAVAAAARVQAPATAAQPAARRQRPWLALVSSALPVLLCCWFRGLLHAYDRPYVRSQL